MKKRKMLISLLLATVMLFTVSATACGGGGDNDPPENLPTGSEVLDQITTYDDTVKLAINFNYDDGVDKVLGDVSAYYYQDGEVKNDNDFSAITAMIDANVKLTVNQDQLDFSTYFRAENDGVQAFIPNVDSDISAEYVRYSYEGVTELVNQYMGTTDDVSMEGLLGALIEGESFTAVNVAGIIMQMVMGGGSSFGSLNSVIDNCTSVEKVDGGFRVNFDLVSYACMNLDKMSEILAEINNKTTLSDLYKNEKFSSYFNLTFKDVMAKDLYDLMIAEAEALDKNEILMLAYTLPEPKDNQTLYEWLGDVLDTEFAMLNGKLGKINLYTLLGVNENGFSEIRQSLLGVKEDLQKNTLKFGLIIKNTKIVGATFNCKLDKTLMQEISSGNGYVTITSTLTVEDANDVELQDVTKLSYVDYALAE